MPLAQEDVTIDPAVIAGVLSRIYHGRYGKAGDKGIDRRLFEATHEVFNLATASGIAEAVNRGVPAPSAQFLELLDRNNAIFSAFRTHNMQKDVASLLLDDKGKIKKFANFKRDVTPVIGKYNGAWLRTEYATAVQRSRLATKWQQFVDESDVFPNLEWVQSTALHPGEDHRIFWFTVRPVDDPFWSHHRPGDRWNCQCDLRQTDLPPTDIPTIPIGDAANSPAPGLDNNPGTDGVIFNDHHPYFPQNCTTCPFANMGKKLMCLAQRSQANCYVCRFVKECISRTSYIAKDIKHVLNHALTNRAQGVSVSVGYIQPYIIDFLKRENITISEKNLFVSDKRIAHAIRQHKVERGAAIEHDDIKKVKRNIERARVFYDKKHSNIIYLYHKKNGEYIKYCFNFNYKVNKKSPPTTQLVTAGKVQLKNIENDVNFIEIKNPQ